MGNGRYYGGTLPIFPRARLDDGELDVCVFPRVNWFTVLQAGLFFAGRRRNGIPGSLHFQTRHLELSGDPPAPLEVEGEAVGRLPAAFKIEPRRLRVIA